MGCIVYGAVSMYGCIDVCHCIALYGCIGRGTTRVMLAPYSCMFRVLPPPCMVADCLTRETILDSITSCGTCIYRFPLYRDHYPASAVRTKPLSVALRVRLSEMSWRNRPTRRHSQSKASSLRSTILCRYGSRRRAAQLGESRERRRRRLLGRPSSKPRRSFWGVAWICIQPTVTHELMYDSMYFWSVFPVLMYFLNETRIVPRR